MVVVASAPDPPYSSGAGRPCRPTYAHRSHPRRENVEDGSRSRVSTVTFRASRVTVSKNSTCSGVAHSMTLAGRDFTTSPRGRPLVLDQPLHPGRDGADRLEVALVDLALVDGQLELLLDECDQLHEAHGVDEVLQQRRVVGHVDVLEQQLVVDERADAPRHVVGLVRFVHGLPPQAIPDQGPPVPAGATRSGARPGRDRSIQSVSMSTRAGCASTGMLALAALEPRRTSTVIRPPEWSRLDAASSSMACWSTRRRGTPPAERPADRRAHPGTGSALPRPRLEQDVEPARQHQGGVPAVVPLPGQGHRRPGPEAVPHHPQHVHAHQLHGQVGRGRGFVHGRGVELDGGGGPGAVAVPRVVEADGRDAPLRQAAGAVRPDAGLVAATHAEPGQEQHQGSGPARRHGQDRRQVLATRGHEQGMLGNHAGAGHRRVRSGHRVRGPHERIPASCHRSDRAHAATAATTRSDRSPCMSSLRPCLLRRNRGRPRRSAAGSTSCCRSTRAPRPRSRSASPPSTGSGSLPLDTWSRSASPSNPRRLPRTSSDEISWYTSRRRGKPSTSRVPAAMSWATGSAASASSPVDTPVSRACLVIHCTYAWPSTAGATAASPAAPAWSAASVATVPPSRRPANPTRCTPATSRSAPAASRASSTWERRLTCSVPRSLSPYPWAWNRRTACPAAASARARAVSRGWRYTCSRAKEWQSTQPSTGVASSGVDRTPTVMAPPMRGCTKASRMPSSRSTNERNEAMRSGSIPTTPPT